MKTMLLVVLALTAVEASAQDGGVTDAPPDAPVAEQQLVINPDGSMPPGRSVKVAQGQPAPFPGQLIDDQEHTRRARINRAKELELEKAKQGKVLLPTAGFVAIITAVAVVVASGSIGIYELARPKSALK